MISRMIHRTAVQLGRTRFLLGLTTILIAAAAIIGLPTPPPNPDVSYRDALLVFPVSDESNISIKTQWELGFTDGLDEPTSAFSVEQESRVAKMDEVYIAATKFVQPLFHECEDVEPVTNLPPDVKELFDVEARERQRSLSWKFYRATNMADESPSVYCFAFAGSIRRHTSTVSVVVPETAILVSSRTFRGPIKLGGTSPDLCDSSIELKRSFPETWILEDSHFGGRSTTVQEEDSPPKTYYDSYCSWGPLDPDHSEVRFATNWLDVSDYRYALPYVARAESVKFFYSALIFGVAGTVGGIVIERLISHRGGPLRQTVDGTQEQPGHRGDIRKQYRAYNDIQQLNRARAVRRRVQVPREPPQE